MSAGDLKETASSVAPDAMEADTSGDNALPALRREVRPCRELDPMLQLVYHELDRQFSAFQAALPKACGHDAEGVHELRNATRRIRSAIKSFRVLLPERAAVALAAEMKWLARILGEVRDLDVHQSLIERSLARLEPDVAAATRPYLEHVADMRTACRSRLEHELRGERVASVLGELSRFLDREPSSAALRRARGFSAREGAEQFSRKLLGKVRRAIRRLDADAAPDELHALRLRCKRLRFLLEACGPVYGDRLGGLIRDMRRIQDTLGAHQDAVVAIERLEAYLGTNRPDAATRHAVRELIRIQREDAVAAQSQFLEDADRLEKRAVKRGKRLLSAG